MKTRKGLPYCVSFDTKEMPGKIVAVKVELTTHIMKDTSEVRIDLVDHALYKHLYDYCVANPPRT